MIDLRVYKNEKQTQNALEIVNAFVEMRMLYDDIKKIAECEDDRYSEGQKFEAEELIKNGYVGFISTMMKLQK